MGYLPISTCNLLNIRPPESCPRGPFSYSALAPFTPCFSYECTTSPTELLGSQGPNKQVCLKHQQPKAPKNEDNSAFLHSRSLRLYFHFSRHANCLSYGCFRASLVAYMVKNLPSMQGTLVLFSGLQKSLEKGMVTDSSILT